MASREIECTINTDGTVEVDMINYSGASCHKDAQEIAEALGKDVTSKRKPEYFKNTPKQKQKVHQRF